MKRKLVIAFLILLVLSCSCLIAQENSKSKYSELINILIEKELTGSKNDTILILSTSKNSLNQFINQVPNYFHKKMIDLFKTSNSKEINNIILASPTLNIEEVKVRYKNVFIFSYLLYPSFREVIQLSVKYKYKKIITSLVTIFTDDKKECLVYYNVFGGEGKTVLFEKVNKSWVIRDSHVESIE